MNKVKDFRLTDVPHHKIVLAATSEPDYEMNRTFLVEEMPSYGFFLVVQGSHCSCYGFDDTTWDATQYTGDELKKVASGWLEHGWGSEKIIAPLILEYIK